MKAWTTVLKGSEMTQKDKRRKLASHKMQVLESLRAAVVVYACSWVDGCCSSTAFKDVINRYRQAAIDAESRWKQEYAR